MPQSRREVYDCGDLERAWKVLVDSDPRNGQVAVEALRRMLVRVCGVCANAFDIIATASRHWVEML